MKILIADDEALSRRLLEKTLERAGYEVIAVENGRAAVRQLCQSDGPRLALLDWVMPEIDGPGVCREVRRQQEDSYVYMVLLTSKEAKEDIVTGLESGADDYLTKPFNVDELKARLRTGERILHLEGRLVEAREMMRFKATHDALTSIWNRGVIMDLLGRELMRSQRECACTIVLLGDVDHFKSVNDTHGHLVGDEVLPGNRTPPSLIDSFLRFCRPIRRRRIPARAQQLQTSIRRSSRRRHPQNCQQPPGPDARRPAEYHDEFWFAA